MAEKKSRSVEELERALAESQKRVEELEIHMKGSGVSVPAAIEGTHKYSGEEEDFKGKVYGFKAGVKRVRFRPLEVTLTATEKEELFDSKGFLLSEKAIKNEKLMNHLIERKSGVLEEIVEEIVEETTNEPKEETTNETPAK